MGRQLDPENGRPYSNQPVAPYSAEQVTQFHRAVKRGIEYFGLEQIQEVQQEFATLRVVVMNHSGLLAEAAERTDCEV